MKIIDWKRIIDDGNLVIKKPSGIFPNAFGWPKDNPRIGAAIVYQSQTDFALGKATLDHALKAKANGRLDEAYVLFVRRGVANGLEFVRAVPAEKIEVRVRNLALYSGNWGSYWWLHADEMPWTEDEDVL